jgi:orotidine-5'-phosphate decarboxylase
VIPALDMPFDQAGEFIDQMLELGIKCFKVGLKVIHLLGTPAAVKAVQEHGGQVFVDAKLSDTPNTMADSAAAIVSHGGVNMFNLHASCGISSMREAVKVRSEAKVLAVSVLTSLSEEEAFLIFGAPVKAKVLQFARDAVLAQVNGMICSPLELGLFNSHSELSCLDRYTPGIRPGWAVAGQQKRFCSPGEAIEAGANGVIIGSPLYNPPSKVESPAEAARLVINEIEEALARMD